MDDPVKDGEPGVAGKRRETLIAGRIAPGKSSASLWKFLQAKSFSIPGKILLQVRG